MNTSPQPRPYRSHRVPACDKCRQRKARCKIDVPGRPCHLCTDKHFDCLFSGTANRPQKRLRLGEIQSTPVSSNKALQSETTPVTSRHQSHQAPFNAGESSIVVGPIVAEDVQILQQYLTAESKQHYSVVSDTPENPIIYLAVPRHRAGQNLAKDPGRAQREILEQVLGPNKQHVIQLYFEHIHPAFPVLDEEAFAESDGCVVSSSLLCEMYAISLTFWNCSAALKPHHCPSEQYFWNSAIAALQQNFLAPNLSTLYPSIVDLLGRPVGSVQGNVVNSGRTTALVYSLGLNRDSSSWKTAARDKRMRIRLFWACMVLDQWYASMVCIKCFMAECLRSSFAHGIPPSIVRRQYDVPLPTIPNLLTRGKETEERTKAAECFIQLCKLSQILGDVLPLVYDLSEPRKEMWRDLRCIECNLDKWEDDLPEYLQTGSIENGTSVSGASSLHLGYLSIRMLLCRVSLRVSHEQHNELDIPALV